MRILLTLILACLLFKNANGQIRVINRSLTDSTLNYFYLAMENVVEVNWKNNTPGAATLSISGEGSRIIKIDESHYYIMVSAITDSCRLRIMQKGGKLLFDQYYKCREINPLTARLGSLSDSVLTIKQILVNPFILAVSPGCYYKLNFSITSFTAEFMHDGEMSVTFTAGNKFSEEQLMLTNRLISGDQIYFSRIVGTFPDSKGRLLPPFRIYIK